MPEKTRQYGGLALFPALCTPSPVTAPSSILWLTAIFHLHHPDSVLFLLCAAALASAAHVVPCLTVKLSGVLKQR